jgi:hypothetical protein
VELQQKAQILADFINFCKNSIGIEKLPKIQFIKDNGWVKQNRTFGQYNSGSRALVVYIGNRNLADICRTLSHELTHHKQNEMGLIGPDSGKTGSPIENQANQVSGIIMREFGKLQSQIYESKVTKNGTGIKSKKRVL